VDLSWARYYLRLKALALGSPIAIFTNQNTKKRVLLDYGELGT